MTCMRGTEIPIYRDSRAGRVRRDEGDWGHLQEPGAHRGHAGGAGVHAGLAFRAGRHGHCDLPLHVPASARRRRLQRHRYHSGHNPETGATCFWTALDEKRTDGVIPALDVSDGDPKKLDALAQTMQLAYEGDKCVSCHDADPFLYTPHLEGVWPWETDVYRFGPYKQVRLVGPADAGRAQATRLRRSVAVHDVPSDRRRTVVRHLRAEQRGNRQRGSPVPAGAVALARADAMDAPPAGDVGSRARRRHRPHPDVLRFPRRADLPLGTDSVAAG